MNVQQLNLHPLNQAALKRLRAEGYSPDPKLLHLLDLAYLGLVGEDGEPPDPFSPLAKALGDWSQGCQLQEAALSHLENSISPNDVEHANLDDLADQVVTTLQGASYHPSD